MPFPPDKRADQPGEGDGNDEENPAGYAIGRECCKRRHVIFIFAPFARNLKLEPQMDWSKCPLVETKPDVQRGRPVIKGTRMPAEDIVENWEDGVGEFEIAQNFGLPVEQVKAILLYAASHQDASHHALPRSFEFIKITPVKKRRTFRNLR